MGAEIVHHIDSLIQKDFPFYRHTAKYHHPVYMRIGSGDAIRLKQPTDMKFPAQFLRSIAFHIVGIGRITNIHPDTSFSNYVLY